jgi:hypothetical protein
MSTNSRLSPYSADSFLEELKAYLYVQEIVSPQPYHYHMLLAIQADAVDVLADYLADSGFLRINREQEHPLRLWVRAAQPDENRVRQEFERAFRKVSQFLEYKELQKEYAHGQVPRHLCQWLLEGGF